MNVFGSKDFVHCALYDYDDCYLLILDIKWTENMFIRSKERKETSERHCMSAYSRVLWFSLFHKIPI